MRPVDGGGGAHGAEAVEKAEDEEDQASSGELMRLSSKGAVLETTSDVEIRRARRRLAAKVGGVQTEVVARRPARIGRRGLGGHDGDGSAVKGSDGGGFFGGVAEPLAGEGRFDFEDGVDALGGKVESGGVREQGRRIEVVEDGDVDLAGAAAGGIDDEGGGGSVTLGEIAIEKLEPVMFGGVTRG